MFELCLILEAVDKSESWYKESLGMAFKVGEWRFLS